MERSGVRGQINFFPDCGAARLHPGYMLDWVRTDMTGHSGLIDVEQSVRGLAGVIERVDSYPPGAFVAFDGKEVPY